MKTKTYQIKDIEQCDLDAATRAEIEDVIHASEEDMKTVNDVKRELRKEIKDEFKEYKKQMRNSESNFKYAYISIAKQNMKDLRKAIRTEAREIKREITDETTQEINDILRSNTQNR